MARLIILDEIHISLLVRRGIPDDEAQLIWQVVVDPRFDTELRRALRRLIRRRSLLDKVRVRIYR